MRLFPSSLGVTAFAAAIAVGVRTHTIPEETARTAELEMLAIAESHRLSDRNGSLHPRHEPSTRPEYHNLSRLTKTLGLSTPQQEIIHPALLRSHPHYQPDRPYLVLGTKHPVYLGPPLTKRDFEDQLFAILDGEQQLDYVAATTEAEAWWRSLISRLEADLESQTNPVDDLPSPHAPEPSVPDAVVPSPNRGRALVLPPSTD